MNAVLHVFMIIDSIIRSRLFFNIVLYPLMGRGLIHADEIEFLAWSSDLIF
jgi:hypothetical protein